MALRLTTSRLLNLQRQCPLQRLLCSYRLSGHLRFPAISLPLQVPVCSNSIPSFDQRTLIHTSSWNSEHKKSQWPFHVTMTEEEKKKKEQRIKEMQEEKPPEGLVAKFKYYFKRYWYIAVPAHAVSCISWFGLMYALVHFGMDVVGLLQALHLPESLIEKVQNVPESAGIIVVALILYKIATPLRYATTLVLIRVAFWGLKRMGLLRTAREVEYTARTKYEINKRLYGRRFYRLQKFYSKF
ncbi:hypothetical protein WR25_03029 isoform B [Diploscapter pachys]|uniref:DUF1279 domain-containing protein n=1 Tax=Diploscapter pachys TaxID=2018661 RepID=A0A2A2LTP0_9BILA|nr:hypothetical protein WR25_03029 isoform B [Diploscapter pachys]